MRPYYGRRRRFGTTADRLFTTLLSQCSVAIGVAVGQRNRTIREGKCYACDVCDEDDVKVCDSIDDLVGVIHCAGVAYGGPFLQTNENDSKLLFDIKYWGTRYAYKASDEGPFVEILLARFFYK